MQIVVNGEDREVPDHVTLAALLESLGLSGQHVAVEVNLQLVPRARHGAHTLAADDRLEVVTLVGGG